MAYVGYISDYLKEIKKEIVICTVQPSVKASVAAVLKLIKKNHLVYNSAT